jgi:hypothetical protein
MSYDSFIENIKCQDERNKFGTTSESDVDFLPNSLKELYINANPKDVEIVLENLTSIKLYPLHQLIDLQKEYKNVDGFVFATHEGDPIFIMDGKVFRAVHGSGTSILDKETLADSIDNFIEFIMNVMRKKIGE